MSKQKEHIKLEHNWRYKTLELLEKKIWPTPKDEDATNLVKKCHALRKKVLNDFAIEDLRLMIGQGIGLGYLVPLAIEVLSDDLLAEGDLHEGDLLQSILNIDSCFWDDNKVFWKTINMLLHRKLRELSEQKIDTGHFYERFYNGGLL